MLIPLLTMFALAAQPQPGAQADPAAALPAFQDICLDDVDPQKGYPGRDTLKTLLGQVPGQPYEFHMQNFGDRPVWQLKGAFQVKQPWENGTAMRLSVFTYNRVRLYFWRGQRGAAMSYHANWYQQWGIYGTTRNGDKFLPDTYALWATDGGRYFQGGGGSVVVLYRDGYLYLTRGDVLLGAVPFDGPPTEVFLETEGMLRGLQFVRCTGTPETPKSHAVVVKIDKPATAAWKAETPKGASLNKLADGGVELAADEKTPACRAVLQVAPPGLNEFLFEIEEPTAGTGVFLGDAAGNPIYQLGVFRQQGTERLMLMLIDPSNGAVEQWADMNGSLVPYVGKRHWVQMVLGAGVVRFSVSGDGVHWSPTFHVASVQGRPCTHVGLYCVAYEKKRSIRLRSIQVRRLDGLTAAAPQAVVDRVPQETGKLKTVPAAAPGGAPQPAVPLAKCGSVEQWLQHVTASRPGDVPAETWQRACALCTLAECPSPAVHQALLLRLLDDVSAGPEKADAKLWAFDDAGRLLNTPDGNTASQLGDCYVRLGQSLLRQNETAPFTAVARGLLRVRSPHRIAVRMPWDELLTAEVVPLMYGNRWKAIEDIVRRIRLWQDPRRIMGGLPGEETPLTELSDWAWASAPRRGSVLTGERVGGAGQWRPLLSPLLSREAYTTATELEAAVRGKGYAEGCQLIAATPNPLSLGLAPDAADRRLIVAFPTAVRLIMDRTPPLRQAMETSYMKIARLRLQGAIHAGDQVAVETVAVQFPGTEVAVDAHQWLGDRALSAGRFAHAIAQYRQAWQGASAAQRVALAARARLAGALQGREMSSPVKQPVKIGNVQMSPEEFERLVSEYRRARAGEAAAAIAWLPSCPAPGKYQVKTVGRIAGNDVEPPRNLPSADLDWGARQMAVAVAPQLMLVSNRALLTALNPADGRVLWEQRMQSDKGQQSWPMVPLRPVVAGSRVYVRRLLKDGPELACLDAADGRQVWRANPETCVASDPLLSGQEVFVLALRSAYPQKLVLSLCRLDAASGELLGQTQLCDFFDAWRGTLPCQAVLIDDKIVATIGGAALCCDLSGRIHWLRQQVCIPPKDAESSVFPWFAQAHEPPLLSRDRLFVTQPGMRSVECLDASTGRLLWEQTIPRLTRTVGVLGERLVVATGDELMGLDTAAGKIAWRRDTPQRLEATLCGWPGGLLCVQPEKLSDPNAPRRAVLAWLDAQTGKTLREQVLEAAPQNKPLFGPLVANGTRQWLLAGVLDRPADREIWELTPVP